MAKLSRFTQLVFGSSAGSNQMAEFGSLAAGTPSTYSGTGISPAIVQTLANYLTGWFGAVIGANSPAIEDMNSLCYLFAYQLAYLMQTGIAEYDASTIYYKGSLATAVGTGVIYVSVADSNTGNALTNSTYWTPLAGNAANSVLNSAFDTWQRGTSIAVANGSSTFHYGPDRFCTTNVIGTSAVVTMAQTTGALSGSIYGCKVSVTTAPGTAAALGAQLYHVLSNVDSMPYYGANGCLSLNIKAVGNVTGVAVQFFYNTSESSSGITGIGTAVTVAINSSTFTVAQIVNQAMGTSMTLAGVVGFSISVSAVSTGHASDSGNGFIVEQVMMNVGGFCAPYKRAHASIASETQALKFYYEKSFNPTQAPASGTGTAGNPLVWAFAPYLDGNVASASRAWRFQSDKRIAPTVTLYNPAVSTAQQIYDATAAVSYTASIGSSITGMAISCNATSTAGNAFSTHFTADAEIV